ncbi:MAG: translocase [Planctomycetaceae bacterium]|nr:translocase [Planctomycetaceae bacterium]
MLRATRRLRACDDLELRRRALDLRWRIRSGAPLGDALVEAFALISESTRRTLGFEHYPVQVLGGIILFEGRIAEMQTGEGKTLTAILPAFLRSLEGMGCHVMTSNDYLARRDSDLVRPLFDRLGVTVGCIQQESDPASRRKAYACDITYGTAKEMGFDLLRDRLAMTPADNAPSRHAATVHRGFHFALVDEADSLLIDEARVPLVIGIAESASAVQKSLHHWARNLATELREDVDFRFESASRSVHLTETGCRKTILTRKPDGFSGFHVDSLYRTVEKALTARLTFRRDREYIVRDEEVHIVDESTGRIAEGRKWQDGLHQAVETLEEVPLSEANVRAAQITMQNFFRQYSNLAGMTGTALPARAELGKTYRISVVRVPTNWPSLRRLMKPRIFLTMEAKYETVADSIESLRQQGRAILVGTPTVSASEALAQVLERREIPFVVLNARQDAQEAEIVRLAGQAGRVTIATNMAGRGTDILLDAPARAAGGLHVLSTEMNTSARIDRQLAGRSARQGDPGSFQQFLSLEDDLLKILPESQVARIQLAAHCGGRSELSCGLLRLFRKAQRRHEALDATRRRQLLELEEHRLRDYEAMGLDPYLELLE